MPTRKPSKTTRKPKPLDLAARVLVLEEKLGWIVATLTGHTDAIATHTSTLESLVSSKPAAVNDCANMAQSIDSAPALAE